MEDDVRVQLPADYVMRAVRGTKMNSIAGVFDEFAAALQFPYYFGENKDAFEECLRDLEEFLGAASGYVIVVRDAECVLASQRDEFGWLTDALRYVGGWWSARQSPVAFRVLALSSYPDGRHRWSTVEVQSPGR
ncbi:hypothetical protein FOS14_01315 [Skermania sp. ID1734]|nr:hypothetical protein FOS14_01315 [Skermania sp. ID1734]